MAKKEVVKGAAKLLKKSKGHTKFKKDRAKQASKKAK
jgi:hypothetical protein